MKVTNADKSVGAIIHRNKLARQSGRWPGWRWHDVPGGVPGSSSWAKEITKAAENGLFVVLVRDIVTDWGPVRHVMITDSVLNIQPTWAERQRIKDELFGAERVAIDVLPPQSQMVNGADAYHIWVLPEGFQLPFGIHAGAGGVVDAQEVAESAA